MELNLANFKRQTTRRQPVPTSSSMPTPSSLNTVEIQHCRQSPNGLTDIGTRENPVYVFGDDEVRCEGCWEEGHFIGDCNREYRFDGRQYVPISEGENLMEPTYVVDKDYY